MRRAEPILARTGLVLAFGLAVGLAGCTSMSGLSGNSTYACKAPEGTACESVSGTYANALQNNLPSQRRSDGTGAPSAPQPARAASAPSNPSSAIAGLPPTPITLRSPPRILRLWFKPWEDSDHDLYDQGYVYVQVDAGQWQIEHVQRQIRDAYAPIKALSRSTGDIKEGASLPANLKNLPRPTQGEAPGSTRPGPTPPEPHSSDIPE